MSTIHSFVERQNANVRKIHFTVFSFLHRRNDFLFAFLRDIILDERDLNFSKSEDEQSEMSNHDYDPDVKPVRSSFLFFSSLDFDDDDDDYSPVGLMR